MGNISKSKAMIGIAFVVLVWGGTWPIYKVALEYTPPLLFAGMRTLLGGILFGLVLLPQWRKLQWKKTWPIYMISALLNIIIFNGVQTVGLQFLPSGLFSVIVYLQPVLVVLLAWLWLKEPMSTLKVVGMLIGFIGVVVVSLDGISGKISYIGILLALITGIGWAIGVVYVKKTSAKVHGLWLVAMQNTIGGLFLSGVGMSVEGLSAIEWNLPYTASLLYGGILGVTGATVVYFKLMSAGESSKVSSFTFLVPLIAVGIGTLLLNEPFTISLFVGMILILFSIYLINSGGFHTKKKPKEYKLDRAENY